MRPQADAADLQTLDVTGQEVISPAQPNSPVDWLSAAFKKLTIEVNLPGGTYDIIKKVPRRPLALETQLEVAHEGTLRTALTLFIFASDADHARGLDCAGALHSSCSSATQCEWLTRPRPPLADHRAGRRLRRPDLEQPHRRRVRQPVRLQSDGDRGRRRLHHVRPCSSSLSFCTTSDESDAPSPLHVLAATSTASTRLSSSSLSRSRSASRRRPATMQRSSSLSGTASCRRSTTAPSRTSSTPSPTRPTSTSTCTAARTVRRFLVLGSAPLLLTDALRPRPRAVTARTNAGDIPISGIPFSVDTNLAGIQSLNARPTVVSNVDVNRGFPDYLRILGASWSPA